jgi:hypothetical protein
MKWYDKMAMAMYGKVTDPQDPANVDSEEFQEGYKVGASDEPEKLTAPKCIEAEWMMRGMPEQDDDRYVGFKEWKRGFWAGRFREGIPSEFR